MQKGPAKIYTIFMRFNAGSPPPQAAPEILHPSCSTFIEEGNFFRKATNRGPFPGAVWQFFRRQGEENRIDPVQPLFC